MSGNGYDKNAVKAWAPAAVYMLLIMAVSFLTIPAPVAPFLVSDKLAHGAAYAVMAWLQARAIFKSGWPVPFEPGPRGRRRLVVRCIVMSGLFGALMEGGQGFLLFRQASVLDAVANFAGAAIGAFAFSRLRLGRMKEQK